MANDLFPKGIIRIKVDGKEHLAEYMGRQKGFECSVCGQGGNCFTFNIFDSVEQYENMQYETWGFGRDHLNHVELVGRVGEFQYEIHTAGATIRS